MKFRVIELFLVLFVLYTVNAKRFSGGGGYRSSGSGSGGSRTSSWGGVSKPRPPVSRPASTSINTGKTSSSDFLHRESGRPSLPVSRPSAPVKSSPPYQSPRPSAPVSTGSHNSAPYPTNTHSFPSTPNHAKPVTDHHQQSSASVAHSDPYSRQPAQNPHASNVPYKPSGGYGPIPQPPPGISLPSSGHSAPYPGGLPNHPHPNPSIGSSSFPTSNGHPPPYSVNPPIQSQHVPNVHSSYNPGPLPSYGSPSYSHGGSYHPPPYSAQAPIYHAPPAYSPSSAFVPGHTPTYVVADTRSKGPGIGTIIGGAVAGGVAAGATNAIVDHAISSIFRPSSNHIHTYPSAPPIGTPTSTVTHTTNNYYYGQPPADNGNNANPLPDQPNNQGVPVNGGTQPQGLPQGSPPGSPQGSPQGVVPQPGDNVPVNTGTQVNSGVPNSAGNSGVNTMPTTNGAVSRTPETQPENSAAPVDNNILTDEKIMQLTEELFDKQDKNLNQYIELNLQKRVSGNTTEDKVVDEAFEPLFLLRTDLDLIPTVSRLRELYQYYQHDGFQKEVFTPERMNAQNAFLDELVKTPVMKRALDWLAEHKYVETDEHEKRELLRHLWFTSINETSSGLERIFLSEKFGDSGLLGMQNWLYFAYLETQNKVNYLGYVDMLSLSGKGSVLKLNYKSDGFTIQNAAIFVGTPPELELALYTICVHARPGNWCPVSLGGAKFYILSRSFRQFGKDVMDIGFPVF